MGMKKFLLVVFFIITLTTSNGFSQNRKIQFVEKPWSEILEMAKTEKKLIFLDAFASWCGPCKWMAANMFTNDTIADYFNSTFICVSIDMEKGEGTQLRTKYEVKYYPTLLFINETGEVVHKKVGAARRAEDYISMGKTALDPNENLSAYMKRFNAGENSDAFIQVLMLRLSDAYMPVQPVLQKYFAGKNDAEMQSRSSWTIIKNYVNDMNLPQFDYLVRHQHDYARLYGKDSVDGKISEIYLNALMKQTRTARATDTMYNALKKKILESGFDRAPAVIFTSDLTLYQMRRQNQQFLDLAYEGVEKYYGTDYNMLNTTAWYVLQICKEGKVTDSLKYLEKAKGWAKKSISIKNDPMNNDTYAALLFYTGQTKEAIMYEEVAISLAKEKSVSSAEYEASLKKMQEQAATKKP
jgi:thiol-disulfide isomerase/thioredoxin